MEKKILTQCNHCKDWFDITNVIGIPYEMFIQPSVNIGDNEVNCNYCGKLTIFNKSTMKFI